MVRSLVQNGVLVVILVPALLSTWPTVTTIEEAGEPKEQLEDQPKKESEKQTKNGPIGELVRLGSVDEVAAIRKDETPKELNLLVVTLRYPVTTSTLQRDKLEDLNRDSSSPLTEKGNELMKLVGKLLMKRYEGHFQHMADDPAYEEEKLIRVTASDLEVAKESARKIIEGINEQSPGLAGKLKLTLSTDNIEKNDYFDPLLLAKQDPTKCKKFTDMPLKTRDPKKLSPLVQPFQKTQTVDEVFQQFNRLQMERLEGLELPAWTKEDKGLPTLRNMKVIAIVQMQSSIGWDHTYWKYFLSNFWNKIFAEFKVLGKDPKPPVPPRHPRLHLHVVDDYLMNALIWWLRMDAVIARAFGASDYTDCYPQAGDSLILEIDNDKKLTAYYLRAVGEQGSSVGLKMLTLEAKAKDFVAPGPQKKHPKLDHITGGLPVHYFTETNVIKDNKWITECKSNK